MKINKEQEEIIINCGAFNYDARKISNIINFDIDYVTSQVKDANSEISILLKKGKDLSDYVIDLKLFELAKSGDIKALEKLDARKRVRS